MNCPHCGFIHLDPLMFCARCRKRINLKRENEMEIRSVKEIDKEIEEHQEEIKRLRKIKTATKKLEELQGNDPQRNNIKAPQNGSK